VNPSDDRAWRWRPWESHPSTASQLLALDTVYHRRAEVKYSQTHRNLADLVPEDGSIW
jgi:hypothetical protein